jgi:hypothetical protein
MKKAEKKYIGIMRRKSGEERIKIAMELRKFALRLSELGIKTQNPKISKKELKKFLFEKIYGFSFPFKKSSK